MASMPSSGPAGTVYVATDQGTCTPLYLSTGGSLTQLYTVGGTGNLVCTGTTLDINPVFVPTKAAANIWTGYNTFTGNVDLTQATVTGLTTFNGLTLTAPLVISINQRHNAAEVHQSLADDYSMIGYVNNLGSSFTTGIGGSLTNRPGDWFVFDSTKGNFPFYIVHGTNEATFSSTVHTPVVQTGELSSGTSGLSRLAGRVSLVNGTGTYPWGKTYGSAPVCTANDETSRSVVQAIATTSSITLNGVGSDTVTYICISGLQ